MYKVEITKDFVGFVVRGANVIVKLADLWAEVGPKLKEILEPLIDYCKKIN